MGGAAGFLDLNGDAAFAGSYGLEITVGGICTASQDEVVTGPAQLQGTFTGCNSLTGSDVEIIGTGATFAAGTRIVLGDNFSVATASPFTAILDSGLLSGLAYLEDDSPNAAVSYNARFQLRLDDLTIGVDGTSDTVEIFSGFSGGATPQFRAVVKRDGTDTEDRLILEVRQDDGSFLATPFGEEILLTPGWHLLQFSWRAVEGDGFFFVTVNGGVPQGGLGPADNGDQVIDSVRLGFVGGSAGSTTGSIDLDDFSSWM